MKKLSEMSLEELWALFPIFLTEHKEDWAKWYAEEKEVLQCSISAPVRITHIGSTAVPGIWAKPIVDVLIEAEEKDFEKTSKEIVSAGYILMDRTSGRSSFNKGYTSEGFAERVFHVHLRRAGDNDEILFKEYLIAHPKTASEYEKLKLRLWKEFEHDRDGYTKAKTDFVRRIVKEAGRK